MTKLSESLNALSPLDDARQLTVREALNQFRVSTQHFQEAPAAATSSDRPAGRVVRLADVEVLLAYSDDPRLNSWIRRCIE